MKSFKKALRLLGYILLILLATVGIGLMGGVPIPTMNKKEDAIEVLVELVEDEEDDLNLSEVK
jgi:hypothetical protein